MSSTWIVSTAGNYWQKQSGLSGSRAAANLVVTESADQPVIGFGGCFNEMGWAALRELSESARDAVLADLFDPSGEGCRFNFARSPIGASDYAMEWYDLSPVAEDYAMEHFTIERDREYLLPYIRSAMKFRPDLWLHCSPWSPPVWMKTHRVCNHGVVRWEPQVLKALALYYLKFIRAYRKEGIDVRQLHVQNEPISDQKFPSCQWNGQRMREFIRDYAGPLFQAEGEPCELWLGTMNTSDYDRWVLPSLADEQARRYIRGVGVQWEGQHLAALVHNAWPEMPLIQTENECSDGSNGWGFALYMARLIWRYMTGGCRAYTYWNMVLPPGGRSTWGWPQNAMITVDPQAKSVTYNPDYYLMKHLSRYVQPGAVRCRTTGAMATNAVAFRNGDGGLVTMAYNPLPETQTLILQAGGKTLAAELPPESVHTLVIQA